MEGSDHWPIYLHLELAGRHPRHPFHFETNLARPPKFSKQDQGMAVLDKQLGMTNNVLLSAAPQVS